MEETPNNKQARHRVDWDAMEPHYRAGIKPLKDLGQEYGCSDAAIVKHANRFGWVRDLQGKIQAKAQAKVSAAQVSAQVSAQTKLREAQVIEANAEIVAQADLLNRKDVAAAINLARSQMEELAAMTDSRFREKLEWLGQINDESFVTDTGREVKDKVNELYRYIVGFHGRVKAMKEIAATHGVYVPMQRRILKLDADADKNQAAVDELLAKINASHD